jgi:hypothetical protein
MKLTTNFLQPENPAHEDINSHSVAAAFSSPDGLDPDELRSLARDLVRTVAAACEEAGAKDVSHVKAFIEHGKGFLHASAVSGNEEITVAGRDGGQAKSFRLVLNAVIFGLPPASIKKAAEQALEAVVVQYGLTQEPANAES